MRLFYYCSICIIFYSCTKTKEITDNLDPYYSFNVSNSEATIDWSKIINIPSNYYWEIPSGTGVSGKMGFQMPNCFTPNNNGLNDVFIAKGFNLRSYSASIYDSKGKLVYSIVDNGIKDDMLTEIIETNKDFPDSVKYVFAKDPDVTTIVQIPPDLIRWDGKLDGKACEEGFYTVKTVVTNLLGKSDSHEMKIYLLRDFTKLPKDISGITLSEELDPRLGKVFESEEKQLMK